MAQRLKRWESPRSEGRNHKGRGGSARQRQKKKQLKALRQKLKDKTNDLTQSNDPKGKDATSAFPFLIARGAFLRIRRRITCC
jgi:hypothetical protein